MTIPSIQDTDIDAMQEALIEWYRDSHRSFPWRQTTDPYAILVSEIMSQQTQLDRIEEPWQDFLDRWPTVTELSNADQADVLEFWTNHRLGYNNRAKYLYEAANQIVEEYDGQIPKSPDELENLSGVGPYTANAVASFAFNNGNAVVDTNVKRILYRIIDTDSVEDIDYDRLADRLFPAGKSRIWNNAIMELGGVVCQKTPRCDEEPCPWREWCQAYHTGDFTAPDVPDQPSFEGSRRQFRGRIIRILSNHDEMTLQDLGPRVRVDFSADGEYDSEWLRDVVSDLSEEGLVELREHGDTLRVSLARSSE